MLKCKLPSCWAILINQANWKTWETINHNHAFTEMSGGEIVLVKRCTLQLKFGKVEL